MLSAPDAPERGPREPLEPGRRDRRARRPVDVTTPSPQHAARSHVRIEGDVEIEIPLTAEIRTDPVVRTTPLLTSEDQGEGLVRPAQAEPERRDHVRHRRA